MKKQLYLILLFSMVLAEAGAQNRTFTHQDTLRGSITQERAWWDLTYYHLDVRVNPSDSTLTGSNLVRYKVTKPYQIMQIDLQQPMKITKVYENNKQVSFKRDGN
ncbi:MAG: hypothetical protein WCW62_17905, partial [Bacteroidales bacterium]